LRVFITMRTPAAVAGAVSPPSRTRPAFIKGSSQAIFGGRYIAINWIGCGRLISRCDR